MAMYIHIIQIVHPQGSRLKNGVAYNKVNSQYRIELSYLFPPQTQVPESPLHGSQSGLTSFIAIQYLTEQHLS